MLNFRNVNIFFILFILIWVFLDRRYNLSPAAYAWILFAYLLVLFCGTYFIQLGYFFKSVCSAGTDKKEIALSFDDGPAESFTPFILDVLKAGKVEAAFFCIGKKIPANEHLLRRIVEEGHIIGNHSYSHHPLFDIFSAERMLEDITQMNELTNHNTGLEPKFFRPPYGVTNPNLKKAVERGGFISIGWSIRSMDTMIRNENRLLQKILQSLKPGAIVLLHDTSPSTMKILKELITQIRQKGYEIVRLDKMIKLNPYA